jgi:hypothetical protein
MTCHIRGIEVTLGAFAQFKGYRYRREVKLGFHYLCSFNCCNDAWITSKLVENVFLNILIPGLYFSDKVWISYEFYTLAHFLKFLETKKTIFKEEKLCIVLSSDVCEWYGSDCNRLYMPKHVLILVITHTPTGSVAEAKLIKMAI